MKLCVVGRGDLQLFPPLEGGSNKIFYTLKYVSLAGVRVYYVTSEHPYYFEVYRGKFRKKPYPPKLRKKVDMERIKDLIAKVFGIPRDETILYHPIFNLQLLRRVLYVVRKEKPDIAQAEFLGFSFPLILSRLMYGLPFILVEHNIECVRMREIFPKFRRGLLFAKIIEFFLGIMCNAIVAAIEEDKERLKQLGVRGSKIFVIPHGVEVSKFSNSSGEWVRKRLGLRYITLMFHGVLGYKPNLWAVRFISKRLVPFLRKKRVKFHVLVVGKYPPADINEEEMIFTGAVKKIEDFIAASDIALVPLKAGGGMRIKVLEYFASGKPVIATQKGVEGFGVKDGKELLIANLDKFPERVLELISSRKLREKLGSNAFRFVQAYDWKNVAKMYVSVYEKILEMRV